MADDRDHLKRQLESLAEEIHQDREAHARLGDHLTNLEAWADQLRKEIDGPPPVPFATSLELS